MLARRLARGRIYYGWYIAAVLFISGFLASAFNSFGPGIFLKPMTEDLGWSRGFFSTVVALGNIFSAPFSILLWPLVDRRGARGVMMVSGALWGLGLVFLGLVQEPWHFIAVKSILIPLGNVGVGIMMAMFVVTNWFVRMRGRAVALTATGMSLGGIVAPPFLTYLISVIGWREAWIVSGITAAVLNVGLAYLFMARRPEDLGLLPDGDKERKATPGKAAAAAEVTWTRGEILRTRTFWLLALALPLGMMGMGVVNQHLIAYLSDKEVGFTRQTASYIMMVISIAAFIIKLPWGFVMERVPIRYCFTFCYTCVALGMTAIILAGDNKFLLVLAAALLGTGWGANTPSQGVLWADYFGRVNQGMARGLSTPITSASGVFGPVLAGFVWDITGTYREIFAAYIVTPAVAIALMLFARPPRKRVPAAQTAEAAGQPPLPEKATRGA